MQINSLFDLSFQLFIYSPRKRRGSEATIARHTALHLFSASLQVAEIRASILKNQEYQTMTEAHDDIYRQYGEEFRHTALVFHVPIAQWHRPEVQYFVNFISCVHQMHEDMLTALDDAAFYPD